MICMMIPSASVKNLMPSSQVVTDPIFVSSYKTINNSIWWVEDWRIATSGWQGVNEGGPWPRHFHSSRPKAPNISSYSTMELFQKVFAPSKKCASKFDCLDELVIVTWTCSLIPLPIVLLSLQMAFLLGLLFTNPCGHAQEQAYIAIFSRWV